MEQRTGDRLAIVAHEIFDGRAMRGPGAVLIEGERILGLGGPSDAEVTGVERVELDKGLLLAPGLVDCQVNGAGGLLVNDDPAEAAIRRIAATHQAFGTTSLLPTLITGAREGMERLSEIDPRAIAGVPGFHLEGPFINMDRRGVHSAGFLRELSAADMELLSAFAQKGACMLTLAPERVPPGAVRAICETGVTVSLGHSNATFQCAHAAADEGARGLTHLFNAMSQITAREPGLVGAAFADERLFTGVIADGSHVAPINLALAHRIIGPDRLMLVSDAMPSVGAPSGSFDLMGRRVELHDGQLTLADGTLAGAHLTLAEAVKRMARLSGASVESALRMATRTPARFLGLDDEIGILAPGAFADLVAFDANHDVARIWLRGRPTASRRFDEASAP